MGERMRIGGKAEGFTLIELMTVVVIIGILGAIVYPSYIESVREARRADAKEALTRIAQAQERHFTLFGRYAANLGGALGPANLGLTVPQQSSESGDSVITNVNPGINIYRLSAAITPADPVCGNLTLDQLGQKTPVNPDCW